MVFLPGESQPPTEEAGGLQSMGTTEVTKHECMCDWRCGWVKSPS